MKISCPHCKESIEATDSMLSEKFNCPVCKSAMMVITCSNAECKKKLPVPEHAFGKKGTCSACGSEILVPLPGGSQEAVPASTKAPISERGQGSVAPTARAGTALAPATPEKLADPASAPLLRPINCRTFALPEVTFTGQVVELAVEPHATLQFDRTHEVLLAFHSAGLPACRAWRLGSWQAVAVDWLPLQNAMATILAAKSNTRLSLAGSGRYTVATLEAQTDPSNPIQAMMIIMATERSQMLWDCATGQWVGEIKSPQAITAAILHVGQRHIAAVMPGSDGIAVFEVPKRGAIVDFAKPLLSFGHGARSVVFANDDAFLVTSTAPVIEDGSVNQEEMVAAYAIPDGTKIIGCTYSLPASHRAGSAELPWRTELAISPRDEVFGMTVVEAERYVCTLRDIVSGDAIGTSLVAESKVRMISVLAERGLVAWVREPAILEVWQLPGPRRLMVEPLSGLPTQIEFSQDGAYLAVVPTGKTKTRIFSFTSEGMVEPPHQAVGSKRTAQQSGAAWWQRLFGKWRALRLVPSSHNE